MQRRNAPAVGLTLGGLVALAVGTFFPLFRMNPLQPADAPVPLGYALELRAGIQSIDVVFLVPACIVGAMVLVARLQFHQAALSVLTGLVAVGFALRYLLLASFGFDATVTFLPGLGWYGLVAGGTALIIAGGYHLGNGSVETLDS